MNARDLSLISFLLLVIGAVLAILFDPYVLLPFAVVAAALMGYSASKYLREHEAIVEYLRQGLSGELSKKVLKDAKDSPAFDKASSQLSMLRRASSTVSKIFSSYMSLLTSVSSRAKELIQDTRRGISKINETFNELLKLSDEVQALVESSGKFERKIGETLDSMAKVQEEISGYSEAQRILKEKSSELEDLVENFEDIYELAMEMEETWKGLSKKLDEVISLSSVIRDIAERTNLLSLNASIEAARVGKEGHGFEVVAEAIKELSEETWKHAEKIESEISTTEQIFLSLSKKMEELISEIKSGKKYASSFRELLQQIMESSHESLRMIEIIKSSFDEITREQIEVRKGVEEIRKGIETMLSFVDDIRRMFNSLSFEIEDKFREMELELNRFVEKKERVEEALAKYPVMIREGVDEEVALQETHSMIKGICSAIYVGKEDGSLKVIPKIVVREVDPRDRPWYKKGIKADTPQWTEPYVDYLSGDFVSTCVLKVSFPDGKKGVIAADVPLKQLLEKGAQHGSE